jgi:hypothetical protein
MTDRLVMTTRDRRRMAGPGRSTKATVLGVKRGAMADGPAGWR